MNNGKHFEIKPCPFCGATPTKEGEPTYTASSKSVAEFEISYQQIVCRNCGAQGPMAQQIEIDPADAKAQALKLWNERIILPGDID